MDSLTSTFSAILPPTSDLTQFASKEGDVLAGQLFQSQLTELFSTAVQVIKMEVVQSTAWLVTFADMVSLVLTFFVLLFSMSNVKVDKWENMIDALSQSLNPTRVEVVVTPTARHNIASVFFKRAINLDYLTSIFEETVLPIRLSPTPTICSVHPFS